MGVDRIEATADRAGQSKYVSAVRQNPSLGVPMLSPEISHVLLSIQTQETLSVPTAALIFGALSQVENLIELAERVCDPVFSRPNHDD